MLELAIILIAIGCFIAGMLTGERRSDGRWVGEGHSRYGTCASQANREAERKTPQTEFDNPGRSL